MVPDEGTPPASAKVDLFDSTYANFEAEVLARIRRKAFGEDFGQNSWTTADEYRRWIAELRLDSGSRVLEVACGAGGPALFLAREAGCRVVGVDINAHGVATANARAHDSGIGDRVSFSVTNADEPLAFPDETFDAVLCVDSAIHFPHRLRVLEEWRRVLRPAGRAVFTDPVVVTGIVSNEELAIRSSIGHFMFAPPGMNERLIRESGLTLIHQGDATENAATVSKRWHDARAEERDALVRIEGEARYAGLQKFFAAVHRLTSERRLSRLTYLVERPA
jgi:SAM-dependent methyltransferase